MITRSTCIYADPAVKVGVACILNWKKCQGTEGISNRTQYWTNGECIYYREAETKEEE